ncbi:MAG TPA: 50S ribosomal protein L6 [Abditibacteriaceae bacterium]|jgi:large subunit ribosomal protein L6
MSRIGRSPITLPKGVTIDIKDGVATVKGPKGTVTAPVPESVTVENTDGVLNLTRASESTQHKSLHGLTRALINNAVVGVSEGFTRVLELRGVGYRAEATPKALNMALGYSHPVNLDLPEGLAAAVQPSTPTLENGYLAATITLTSHDKQILGDFAADVKGRRSVEPYKGKGLRYKGELVKRKQGKTEGKKK